jgi:hypothetical protein
MLLVRLERREERSESGGVESDPPRGIDFAAAQDEYDDDDLLLLLLLVMDLLRR